MNVGSMVGTFESRFSKHYKQGKAGRADTFMSQSAIVLTVPSR